MTNGSRRVLWILEKHRYNVEQARPLCVKSAISLPNHKAHAMKTIIQLSEAEEAKALPILLRHSPGTVLPNRIYVVSVEVAKKLREAGVQFTELSREASAPRLEGVGFGERI